MYREGLSGNILLGMFFALIIGVMAIFFKASEANVNIFGGCSRQIICIYL